MSLDQNLFTLHVIPNKSDTSGLILDLVDPSGNVHYRRQRVPGQVYKIEVYDPIAESLLAAATAPSATSKHKTLELYNPNQIVELKFVGTLTFRWAFKWEDHEFEWKREECFMIRKPDPPVLVAVTKEPPGRIKTTAIQILDYNLNRFDIEDRKGLEIVILTALLSFRDASDVYHDPNSETSTPSTAATTLSATPPAPKTFFGTASRKTSDPTVLSPPAPPPKPAPKTGIERIVEMQLARGEVNEVSVAEEGNVGDYARYCANMLDDDAMLFITVRSFSAAQVPKVLQVVEETKRIRHKAGLSDESDLHQYVVYDTTPTPGKKGPRIINLDDDKNKNKGKEADKYTPPNSLLVHLSKIDMPELQPRTGPSSSGYVTGNIASEMEKTKKKGGKGNKEKEKKEKQREKDRDKKSTSNAESKNASKLAKSQPIVPPSVATSSSHPHVRHQTQQHPRSASQPNNPTIYTVPPLSPHPMGNTPNYPPHNPPPYPSRPPPYPSRHPSNPNQLYVPTPAQAPQRPTTPSSSAVAVASGLLGKLLGASK